jgi:hypothetical protein
VTEPLVPEEAEEVADADLEALDAMAEALLDAIIQARTDENLDGMAGPAAAEPDATNPPSPSP